MCAAHNAAHNAANDKDDDDCDRNNPPSRAIPHHLRGRSTILKLPVFAHEGNGAGTVALSKWLLVDGCGVWRMAIAAFYVVDLLSNGERRLRSGEVMRTMGKGSRKKGAMSNVPVFLPVSGQEG